MSTRDAIANLFGAACAFATVGIFIVFAVGYGFSRFWNLFAPDLFDAPAATISNGIGAAGLLFCARVCLGLSAEYKG